MDIIFQSYIERILRLLYQYLLYDQTFVYFSIPSRQMNECWIFIAHIPYHFSPPATYINSSNAFKYFPRQNFLKDRGITETFTSALRYQHTITKHSTRKYYRKLTPIAKSFKKSYLQPQFLHTKNRKGRSGRSTVLN